MPRGPGEHHIVLRAEFPLVEWGRLEISLVVFLLHIHRIFFVLLLLQHTCATSAGQLIFRLGGI